MKLTDFAVARQLREEHRSLVEVELPIALAAYGNVRSRPLLATVNRSPVKLDVSCKAEHINFNILRARMKRLKAF